MVVIVVASATSVRALVSADAPHRRRVSWLNVRAADLAGGRAGVGCRRGAHGGHVPADAQRRVALVRPAARRRLTVGRGLPEPIRALEGKHALVLDRVDGQQGRVKLDGEVWSARPLDENDSYEPGASPRSYGPRQTQGYGTSRPPGRHRSAGPALGVSESAEKDRARWRSGAAKTRLPGDHRRVRWAVGQPAQPAPTSARTHPEAPLPPTPATPAA